MKNHCPPTPRGETYCHGHTSLIYTLDGKLSQLLLFIFLKHLENKAAEHLSPWALCSFSLAQGETRPLHWGTSLQHMFPPTVPYYQGRD